MADEAPHFDCCFEGVPPNLLSHLTIQVDRLKEGSTLGSADNNGHDLQIYRV